MTIVIPVFITLFFIYFTAASDLHMPELQDINTLSDVQHMVRSFYSKVRADDFIGPIFNERIGDRWEEHLDTLSRFWESILLGGNAYNGRPFPPHAQMPIGKEHFERWLGLFIDNVDSQFKGPNAEEAKLRAFNIANVFLHKLAHIRGEQLKD